MSEEISREEFEELVIKYTKNICNDIIKNGFNGIEGWVRELISSEFILNQKQKTKKMSKSRCCNEYAIKYSSTGIKGDVNTHYTCTYCGKISDKPKQRR
jgi:hypothetical protein